MFEYLYYKLYQAALKSSLHDIPHIAASCWMGGLLGLNIIGINMILAKTVSFPWFFANHKVAGWFGLTVIISLALFFSKQRRIAIIEKYASESSRKRIRGNVAVTIYVGVTIILIFMLPLYRPGKF